MTPQTQYALKIIAGAVLIISLLLGFFERRYRPNYLKWENSPNFPHWLGWLGWGLATLAALTYIAVDIVDIFGK